MTFFAQQFIDFIVQVANTKFTETSCKFKWWIREKFLFESFGHPYLPFCICATFFDISLMISRRHFSHLETSVHSDAKYGRRSLSPVSASFAARHRASVVLERQDNFIHDRMSSNPSIVFNWFLTLLSLHFVPENNCKKEKMCLNFRGLAFVDGFLCNKFTISARIWAPIDFWKQIIPILRVMCMHASSEYHKRTEPMLTGQQKQTLRAGDALTATDRCGHFGNHQIIH